MIKFINWVILVWKVKVLILFFFMCLGLGICKERLVIYFLYDRVLIKIMFYLYFSYESNFNVIKSFIFNFLLFNMKNLILMNNGYIFINWVDNNIFIYRMN